MLSCSFLNWNYTQKKVLPVRELIYTYYLYIEILILEILKNNNSKIADEKKCVKQSKINRKLQ